MQNDIKLIIFDALENTVQPEVAKWLDDFFTTKFGKYYWNDYIENSYVKHVKKWPSHYDSFKDIDISTLWNIVQYFKESFYNPNDEKYGNLYNIKQAIGILNDLRNKTDHNSANNINKLSVDDLYSIVHSLNIIKASEESKNKIKKIIKSVTFNHIEMSNDKPTIIDRQNLISYTSPNEWTRTTAAIYCHEQGYTLCKRFNFASLNRTAKGEYWINPSLDFVNYDWEIILNDKDNQCFHILHIPANTFTIKDFNIKTNRQGSKIDLYIDTKELKDRKGANFKPYLIRTIKY